MMGAQEFLNNVKAALRRTAWKFGQHKQLGDKGTSKRTRVVVQL